MELHLIASVQRRFAVSVVVRLFFSCFRCPTALMISTLVDASSWFLDDNFFTSRVFVLLFSYSFGEVVS
ncbi:hypothetical protein Pla52o_04460 [Novipirellula galeiformis]|uniref:Uncharacterized protein n=1 Tax=Novipirellula galeiformis TaxID=2528004 RepID=A0A5C6CNR0_9BACT|nr:hypothetical protein Pla52o_04460 [Novipirellula galeiformis]